MTALTPRLVDTVDGSLREGTGPGPGLTEDAGSPIGPPPGAAPPFWVTIEAEGCSGRACLGGEIDLAAAPTITAALSRLVGAGVRMLTVDLDGTTFIDCSGLRPIIEVSRSGIDLRIVNASPSIRRPLVAYDLVPCPDAATVGASQGERRLAANGSGPAADPS